MKNIGFIRFIFLIVLFSISASCNSKNPTSVPEITILTTALGKDGDKFPDDLVKFWKPISIKQDSDSKEIAPTIRLLRIDLAEEKELVVPSSNSWIDNLIKPDPRVGLKRSHDYLDQFKISGSFSSNQTPDVNQVLTRKEKYKGEIPTVFEIVESNSSLSENQALSSNELLQKLKGRIEKDIQIQAPLKYLVFYKLNPSSNIAPSVNPAPPTPSVIPSASNQDLFGVIEIGASGIKPAVLQMVYSAEEDQYTVTEKGKQKEKKYDVVTLDANNRAAFHPDSKELIANDLKGYVDEFQLNYAVPKEHIYIVGSSSVAQVEHKDELKQAVKESTGIDMDFVTAEQEGRHVFNGTLKLIPKERGQHDRREKEAVVIDIGSGNTKGGYYDTSTKQVATFEIKYGTKTFSKQVDKERGDKSFADMAKNLSSRELIPAIKSEASRVPGLENKDRVYLIGGISWATSTLLSLDSPYYTKRSQTGDQAIYTAMNFKGISDVDRLYNRVIGDKAIEQVCKNNADANNFTDASKKEKRIKNINDICSGIFSMDQLTGGLQILKALAQELKFDKKHVFFIQNTLYAWPLGYVREKIEQSNN